MAVLFLWQILHLYWLTTNVVADKLLGYPLFSPSEFYETLLVVADYFEIPALISGTILYIYSFGKKRNIKNLLFILMINSQWLHLFWLTDAFVVQHFRGDIVNLPIWLAWVAIMIDYLELPVIYDTVKNVVKRKILTEDVS